MRFCFNCKFSNNSILDRSCDKCVNLGNGTVDYFTLNITPEQPTTPHMPPVNQPKTGEEINHPTRYAGGKYECIDVMTDVFGVDAVKSFCKLNAFKYLWREKNKNGVEDLKKCAWYLNKLIELSGTDENV